MALQHLSCHTWHCGHQVTFASVKIGKIVELVEAWLTPKIVFSVACAAQCRAAMTHVEPTHPVAAPTTD